MWDHVSGMDVRMCVHMCHTYVCVHVQHTYMFIYLYTYYVPRMTKNIFQVVVGSTARLGPYRRLQIRNSKMLR